MIMVGESIRYILVNVFLSALLSEDGKSSRSPTSPFSDMCEERCKACSHQDVVRALPMSPAYARTSTPGPVNTISSEPLCTTISEEK